MVRNKQLEVNVPWVVLDSFELNMNDRLYYKVVDPAGRLSLVMTIYRRCRLHLAHAALSGAGMVLSH